MHYNWCSSHVLPGASPQENELPMSHSYYDATWNSIISPGCDEMEESQLSGYLHWLEKKVNEESKKSDDMNEIDKLADMFIANCHEKFKLEKQESGLGIVGVKEVLFVSTLRSSGSENCTSCELLSLCISSVGHMYGYI
ncbi:hypothetical protein ACET3Z_024308 [Daucus carota]